MNKIDNGAGLEYSRAERRWRRKFDDSLPPSSRSKGLKEAGKVKDTDIGEEGAFPAPELDYERFLKFCGMGLTSSEQCDPLDKDDDVVCLGEDNGLDAEYISFLDGLRKDGNLYFWEDGVSRVIRYEEEEEVDLSDCVNEGSLEDLNKRKTRSTERNLGSNLQEMDRERAKAELLSSRQRSQRSVPSFESRWPQVLRSSRANGNCDMVSDSDVDEKYGELLNGLKTVGENLVVMLKDGKQITLFEDDESSSDSEVLVVDPFCDGCSPFVPSKEYQNLPGEKNWEDIQTPFRSPFRDKLMNLLKKPFSQKEYDNLWKDINRKKPIEGHKELREGREMKVILNSTGKSYLDDYGELFKMLDSAKRDRCKRLSLLRGFFYWLQNRPQDDSFKPWLDSSFLDAL